MVIDVRRCARQAEISSGDSKIRASHFSRSLTSRPPVAWVLKVVQLQMHLIEFFLNGKHLLFTKNHYLIILYLEVRIPTYQ